MSYRPNPFKPYQQRKVNASNHPKTVYNRQVTSKLRGLKLAEYREDVAFRCRKHRALKRIRQAPEWSQYNTEEQAIKESELIATLKAESEANKLEYRREWKRKIEMNEIDEEEEQLDFQSEESEVNGILSQNESEDGDEVGSLVWILSG